MRHIPSWSPNHRHNVTPARGRHGAALVETAATLCLLTMMMVMAIGFLVNVTTMYYYKQKLGLISAQAAQFAGTLGPANVNTQQFVDDLLTEIKLPKSKSVSVDTSTAPNTVIVTLTVDALPLLLPGGVFPQTVSITDISAAPLLSPPVVGSLFFGCDVGTNSGHHFWSPLVKYLPAGQSGWRLEWPGMATDIPSDNTSGPANLR